MVDAEGRVSYYGTTLANKAVILNEWGFINMADLDTRPLVTGQLTAETASCGRETLPVFDVWPEREGGSPFQKGTRCSAAHALIPGAPDDGVSTESLTGLAIELFSSSGPLRSAGLPRRA